MEIKSLKGEMGAVVMTPDEFEWAVSVTSDMVGVLNLRMEGHTVDEAVVLTSLFLANMSRWFQKTFSMYSQELTTEEEWADLVCNQAKGFLKQL